MVVVGEKERSEEISTSFAITSKPLRATLDPTPAETTTNDKINTNKNEMIRVIFVLIDIFLPSFGLNPSQNPVSIFPRLGSFVILP
ncbi:hypothetical protein CVT91_03655 [Candidatus Atribacteria bacterium HGW-Atribacteria-1]|nr:MAG: hypothetical protein CVT91_03655 [Candidatus Atribacteria bacterium HGW-Atribacteria-1]